MTRNSSCSLALKMLLTQPTKELTLLLPLSQGRAYPPRARKTWILIPGSLMGFWTHTCSLPMTRYSNWEMLSNASSISFPNLQRAIKYSVGNREYAQPQPGNWDTNFPVFRTCSNDCSSEQNAQGREPHAPSACCARHAAARPQGPSCWGSSAPAWPGQWGTHLQGILAVRLLGTSIARQALNNVFWGFRFWIQLVCAT